MRNRHDGPEEDEDPPGYLVYTRVVITEEREVLCDYFQHLGKNKSEFTTRLQAEVWHRENGISLEIHNHNFDL